jgi:hypothetical protein
MSTILKTLKKLEEDKRLLEKDLDLKELVLQEDQKLPVTLEFSRKNFLMTGLILAGIIVVTLVFFGRSYVKNEEVSFSQVPQVQKPASIMRKEVVPTLGISLSNIPEQRQHYEERARKTPSPTIKKTPVREIIQPTIVKPEPFPHDINEIRDLIQTATSESMQPESNPYPEELVSRGISIPNLKVKGIIFFTSGSPSNHIFVSTSAIKNRKVRVGDTVQSATLMHIESNRVVFSYQGETVHLHIGE